MAGVRAWEGALLQRSSDGSYFNPARAESPRGRFSYTASMKTQQVITLLLAAFLAFSAAGRLHADFVLDPQPGYQEFHGELAVQSEGNSLLTWTRQTEPGGPWTAAAATLDPSSGQLGDVHEWGNGGGEQVVAIDSGFLAIREEVETSPDWTVEHLDASGQRLGTALQIGFAVSVSSHATAGGGAVVVAVTNTGTQAWKLGSSGAVLAGPVTLTDSSLKASVGVDADGNLVLVWTDLGNRVFARRFSPDLEPLGPPLPVTLGGAFGVRVVVAPDGRFVVVYDQLFRVWIRPFHADGTPAGARLRISPDSVEQEDIDVAIRARFVSLAGRTLGQAIRLGQIASGRGELLRPRAESLAAGDFLVVWTRVNASGEKLVLVGQHISPR